MAVGFDGVVQRSDDILPVRIGFDIGEILFQGLTANGEAIAVQQPCIEQSLHQWSNAADANQFGHHVAPTGTQIAEHRYARSDSRKIVNVQRYTGLMGNSQEV